MAGSMDLTIVINAKDQASKTIKGFSGMIQKHSRAIGLASTAMGAAILGSAVMSVKAYAQMGDEVHKMALRTGIATEALSELRHAAELSGADLATVEKGVKKMSKTIVDANDGLLTYQRSFNRINISYEEMMELAPEEQFWTIATALGELENQTIKAAAAQDIFGRAGTQLLPLFDAGAEGIAEMRQEAHDLGIVFSQEAANAAAQFTDNMTRLKGSMNGLKFTIAEAAMPAIEGLVTKVTDITKGIREWMDEHPALAQTLMKVTLAVGALAAAIGPLLIFLPQIIAAVGLLKIAFASALGPIGLAVVATTALVGALILFVDKSKDAIDKAKDLTTNLANVQTEISTLRDRITEMARAADPYAVEALEALQRQLDDLLEDENKAWKKRDAAIRDAQKELAFWMQAEELSIKLHAEDATSVKELHEKVEEYRSALKELGSEMVNGFASWEEARKLMIDQATATSEATEATATMDEHIAEATSTLGSHGQALSVMEGVLEDATEAWEDAKDVVSGLESQINSVNAEIERLMHPDLEGADAFKDAMFELDQALRQLGIDQIDANQAMKDAQTEYQKLAIDESQYSGSALDAAKSFNAILQEQIDTRQAVVDALGEETSTLETEKRRQTLIYEKEHEAQIHALEEQGEAYLGLGEASEISFNTASDNMRFLAETAVPVFETALKEAQETMRDTSAARDMAVGVVKHITWMQHVASLQLDELKAKADGTFTAMVRSAWAAANSIRAAFSIVTGGGGGGGATVPATPMQHGGIITRPTMVLAGEAGREAIIPLDRGGGMGGIGNTYVSVYLDGEDMTRVLIDRVADGLRGEGIKVR